MALTLIALSSNAFEKAERGLAGSIDGATAIVESAERFWHELESFGDDRRAERPPMQLVTPDLVLDTGVRVAEPSIDIQTIELSELHE